jgi:hypothetical protein
MGAHYRLPPWKKPKPGKRKGTGFKLTPTQKAAAREAARKAGRPYPNLVDNMAAARRGKG